MNEPPPFPTTPAAKPKTGLSITSLVLGISSVVLCLGFLTGMPAIITGFIAQGRTKKQPEIYGGARMALTGIILGFVGTIIISTLLVLAGLLLPALAKAKSRAQSINCMSNMKMVGLAAPLWSGDHNDKFPPDFLTLSNELTTPKYLVCPGDSTKTAVTNWAQFRAAQNVSYEFLRPNRKEPLDLAAAGQTVVLRCPIHGNEGMADGSVHQGSARRR